MEKCKYCNSQNLILEARVKWHDVETANQVALKCAKCGKWLKWCPKSERAKYIHNEHNNENSNAINLLPNNDDKHARGNPQKAVEVLKKYIDLIEDIYHYTIKYINDTEIKLVEHFDKLLDQLDELVERKEREAKGE